MNSQNFDELFHRALDLAPAERTAFLRARCGRDAALFRKLDALLRSDAAAENDAFLGTPAFALDAENLLLDGEDAGDALVGQTIGRWKIVASIGAGGMGAVYRAERADGQFEKQVALKIVKRGMDTDEILRRFLRERQILANLEHSNIARLLDAGTTDKGTPFFVMELVEGVPVDEFCLDGNLPLGEKLKLFRTICLAIAHAHRNLVVHRDLKPSNILVTKDGTPKLLDFGIAKLLDETDASETQTQWRVLTPAYAAPEQKTGGAITTATDVYALGLILKELIGSSLSVVRSPLLKIRTLENNEQRTTNNGQRTKLPADLQAILQTAAREEPEKRYDSAARLADDIENFLGGLPIAARPDAFFYRAEKFVRRNRVATFAAALVFLALAAGFGTALWQARAAQIERARAEQRFEETRGIAKALIFNYHDEISKLQGATRVRSLMVSDAIKYLDSLANDNSAISDPNLRLELIEGYLRLGDVQGQPYGESLSDSAGAIESYRKAERLASETAENSPDDLALLKTKATVFHRLSQILLRQNSSFGQAIEYAEKAFAAREKILFLEANDANRLEHAKQHLNLAMITATTDVQASLRVLQRGAPVAAELLQSDPDNFEVRILNARFSGRRAFHTAQMGQEKMVVWNESEARQFYESAVPHFERAIESAERVAADAPDNRAYRRTVYIYKSNFAEVLGELGRTDEALELKRWVLDYSLKQFANDTANREIKHEVAQHHLDLARIQLYRGERRTAAENFERGIEMLDELIRADPQNSEVAEFQIANFTSYHGDSQIKIGDLGGALVNYRRAAEKAASYFKDSAEIRKRHDVFINLRFGDIHRFKAQKQTTQARQKDLTAARDFYRQSVELLPSNNQQFGEISKYLNEKIAECEAELEK